MNVKIITFEILQEVFTNNKYFSKSVLVPQFIRENFFMKDHSFLAIEADTKKRSTR